MLTKRKKYVHWKTLRRIRRHAEESIYGIKAEGADYYSFTLIGKDKHGLVAWRGYYCWSKKSMFEGEDYSIRLEDPTETLYYNPAGINEIIGR